MKKSYVTVPARLLTEAAIESINISHATYRACIHGIASLLAVANQQSIDALMLWTTYSGRINVVDGGLLLDHDKPLGMLPTGGAPSLVEIAAHIVSRDLSTQKD